MEKLRILITDDTESKIEAIKNLLIKECTIADTDIDIAKNVAEAREYLLKHLYHLVIIDMVLPLMPDSPNPEEEAGIKFVEEIYGNPSIIKPIHIIGLTQYKESYLSLSNRLQDKLWYLIHYNQSSTDWRDMIKQKVFQIQLTIKSVEESFENKNKYDIGIICALHEEFDRMKLSFEDGIDGWKRQSVKGFPLDFYSTDILTQNNNKLRICAICPSKPGVVPTASIAIAAYSFLKVDTIFMTGFAAGFESNDMQFGDIIIAKSVQDYATGKLVERKEVNADGSSETTFYNLIKEIQQIQADDRLVAMANDVADDTDCIDDINKFVSNRTSENVRLNAKAAPTVCGPFVVAAGTAMNEIKQNDRKLAALDMEGYGLYYAAHFYRKQALWIKGLCDFGNSAKGDQYHVRCALASGRFLYNLIKYYM